MLRPKGSAKTTTSELLQNSTQGVPKSGDGDVLTEMSFGE